MSMVTNVAVAAIIWLFTAQAACSHASIQHAAAAVSPSVVRIDVVLPSGKAQQADASEAPTLFRSTNGSGFVFDGAGRIITAAHVVRHAISIDVVGADGTRRRARLIGVDAATDVAVIEVEGEVPPPLTVRENTPDIGDPVAAIGAPYGMDGAVSFGHVNGHWRARRAAAPAIHLQHDAAVNPASSGGPVIAEDGTVVGINVAIPDGQFEFAGIALAVEGAIVRRVASELITAGQVERAALGATLRALDPMLLAAVPTAADAGALVTSVEPGGPAGEAGLRSGDLVLALNGNPVGALSELLRLLDDHRAGELVAFTVRRGDGGATLTLSLTLAPADADRSPESLPPIAHGLTFAAAAPARVAAVEAGSLGAVAGIVSGDTVHAVDLVPVADGVAAERALARGEGLTALLVSRDGGEPRLLVLGTDPSEAGMLSGNTVGLLSARR